MKKAQIKIIKVQLENYSKFHVYDACGSCYTRKNASTMLEELLIKFPETKTILMIPLEKLLEILNYAPSE